MGDIMHALPAVHAIKLATSAEIDWVAHSEYVELIRCFPCVDRVIPFPRHAFVRRFSRFLQELRASKYDYALDFQGLLKSAMVCMLARCNTRIGPALPREGSKLFYSRRAERCAADTHAVAQNMAIARLLGVQPEQCGQLPKLNVPSYKFNLPAPLVAIVPGSRWPAKKWPASKFAETAMLMLEQRSIGFFLLGGPDDQAACRVIQEALPPGLALNLAGKASIVETASILGEMSLVIGNDTGPLHIAAMLKVPTVTIMGPTDERRTGPWGNRNTVVRAPIECAPCLRRRCKFKHSRCMTEIQPVLVARIALRKLDANET